MPYRVELAGPREVVRGRDLTLTLPLRSDANVEQTVTGSPTLSVWLGSAVLLDEVAVAPGPPASYALLAATTEDEGLSDEWLERWTTNLGVFTHTGHLCRTGFFSHVTDGAMQRVHPELLDFLAPGETTAEKARTLAADRVVRQLASRGRRPWLVWDQWELYEPELYYALHYWANDARFRTTGAHDYQALAVEYDAKATALWKAATSFREDTSETGVIVDTEPVPAETGGYVLTAGRSRSNRAWFR